MAWLYMDCIGGISGDMMLGALIDLGVPVDYVREQLKSIDISGYHINISRRMVGAIDATKCQIIIEHTSPHDQSHDPSHDHTQGLSHEHTQGLSHDHTQGLSHEHTQGHSHEHTQGHSHEHTQGHSHEHTQGHSHEHTQGHSHEHTQSHSHEHTQGHLHIEGEIARDYKCIRNLIEQSELSTRVKDRVLGAFGELAKAEGKIHGISPEDVSFHEVGAVDSIVDIVGSAVALDYLGVERIFCSAMPLGKGFVNCQHGLLPLPAPATLELLRGKPVVGTGIKAELVTPTGAAFVAAWVDEFGEIPQFVLEGIGYGAGSRSLQERPNVLRLLIGKAVDNADIACDALLQIECNIDDIAPEQLAYTVERLIDSGARDVWLTAIQMKKGRPAQMLNVLCETHQLSTIEQVIFTQTSTFGFRYFPVNRKILQREFQRVETAYGEITLKIGRDANRIYTVSPEYEDCRQLALKTGIALKEIYAAALSTWRKNLNR
jgi:hypothetical protein